MVILIVGVLFAAPVFIGVSHHMTFGNARSPGGPGPEPPDFKDKRSVTSLKLFLWASLRNIGGRGSRSVGNPCLGFGS